MSIATHTLLSLGLSTTNGSDRIPHGLHTFISLDVPGMLAGLLAAVSCGLLGNFLVLRRMSMMGDAISHSVLPGLVIAFLIAGHRATWEMFLGAAAAGLATVIFVELIRGLGRVESGAAMGVVFSVLFALGVLLIERAGARHLDLDASCVLYGQLEYIFWMPPDTWSELLTMESLREAVAELRQLSILAVLAVICALFVTVFFKELRISAFDPALATSLGIHAGAMHVALMVVVAGAVVASFEAVGSILVIAMLICPAATARLLTDRLGSQIAVSLLAASLSAILGYIFAAWGPGWIGMSDAVSGAGMMTVVAGVLLAIAALFGPRHGIIARQWRRLRLSLKVAGEDVLAMLYRAEELGRSHIPPEALARTLRRRVVVPLAIRRVIRSGHITRTQEGLTLRDSGRAQAREIVRSHRLWEWYLVHELGLRPDHVHRTAARLEHLTREGDGGRLEPETDAPLLDPHNRPIPPQGPTGDPRRPDTQDEDPRTEN